LESGFSTGSLAMLDLLRSLSLGSGAIVVGLCSAVSAVFLARIQTSSLRWLLLVATPILLSFVLYWSPVWFGANPSEYSVWSLLGIGAWSFAGLLVSVIVGLIVTKYRNKLRPQHG
jgi:hypothetical protein